MTPTIHLTETTDTDTDTGPGPGPGPAAAAAAAWPHLAFLAGLPHDAWEGTVVRWLLGKDAARAAAAAGLLRRMGASGTEWVLTAAFARRRRPAAQAGAFDALARLGTPITHGRWLDLTLAATRSPEPARSAAARALAAVGRPVGY